MLIGITNKQNTKTHAERVMTEPVDPWMNKRTICVFAPFPGEHNRVSLKRRIQQLSRFLSDEDGQVHSVTSNPHAIVDVTGDEMAAASKDENVRTISH